MKTYYPGILVETNVPLEVLKYEMKITNIIDGSVLYETTLHRDLKGKKIIEQIQAENPRNYKITIKLYRIYDNHKPIEVSEYIISSGLSHFISPSYLETISPMVYKESCHTMKEVRKDKDYVVEIKISRKKRIFEALEHPEGDPLDPFAKEKIEEQLKERLALRSYPDQGLSPLCGPAAYFYCLLKDRPDIYRQMVKELWETGETKFRELFIKADSSKKPKNFFDETDTPKIFGIDWITMASLKDFSNFWGFSSPNQDVRGITMWNIMKEWFTKSGAQLLFDNITILGSSLEDILMLNYYKLKYPDCHIVNLVNSKDLLKNVENAPFPINHWIVWNDLVRTDDGQALNSNSSLNDKVSLNLFTWGSITDNSTSLYRDTTADLKENITLSVFLKAMYGALVFTKIP